MSEQNLNQQLAQLQRQISFHQGQMEERQTDFEKQKEIIEKRFGTIEPDKLQAIYKSMRERYKSLQQLMQKGVSLGTDIVKQLNEGKVDPDLKVELHNVIEAIQTELARNPNDMPEQQTASQTPTTSEAEAAPEESAEREKTSLNSLSPQFSEQDQGDSRKSDLGSINKSKDTTVNETPQPALNESVNDIGTSL
ncbi:hypothetical protein [Idiomarina abyssalis]|uniref:Uncharacterized protein n=1 Tax=Idiomarina abyssalis TaxID=86102 RepID=A0A8I1GEU8_9GAMM|nr:hypothetical protein [Idiomarina abyssalis]MBJ7265603.1 hypothetical protein [Idiomarina abyssalis]MBJ7316723.1 hypothetical protein [Idiomarina abyssalis]